MRCFSQSMVTPPRFSSVVERQSRGIVQNVLDLGGRARTEIVGRVGAAQHLCADVLRKIGRAGRQGVVLAHHELRGESEESQARLELRDRIVGAGDLE